jgi:hypothetical protein
MKKYLDIACGEAPHWLVKSLENPGGFYVGVDSRPWKMSPMEFYWKAKEFMLNDAYRKNVPRERHGIPQFIDELAIASWLIDIEPGKRQDFLKEGKCPNGPDYYEINSRIEELRAHREGKAILATKVSDLIYDDKGILKADAETFPEISGTPKDNRSIYHSGFYAWNKIKKECFGNKADFTMENVLKLPFPSELKAKLGGALSRVHLVKGDMYKLPFKDASFDYVRGSGYDFPENSVSEAQRILKKGRIVPVWINGIDTEFD